jgi:hypothetical protein
MKMMSPSNKPLIEAGSMKACVQRVVIEAGSMKACVQRVVIEAGSAAWDRPGYGIWTKVERVAPHSL